MFFGLRFKKLLAIILVVFTLISLCSCTPEKPKENNSESSQHSDNLLPNGGDDTVSNGSDETDDMKDFEDFDFDMGFSTVSDSSSLIACYDGSNYRFGLTEYGVCIAYYDRENNKFYDTFSDDVFYQNDEEGTILTFTGSILSAKKVKVDGYNGVRVNYEATSGNIYTTYKFADDYIGVSSVLQWKGDSVAGSGYYKRGILASVSGYSMTTTGKWNFTETEPYRDVDAHVMEHEFGSYKTYTFVEKNGASSATNTFTMDTIPVAASGTTSQDYKIDMSIRFEKIGSFTDNITDAAAIVKEQDFSIELSPSNQVDQEIKTMVFTNKSVDFTVKVKNVTEKTITPKYNCKVMDYYGNIVGDSSQNIGSIKKGQQKEFKITVNSSNLGSHFMYLYTSNGNKTVTNYYTYSVKQAKNIKYHNTNPFGVSGGTDSRAHLEGLKALGASTSRVGFRSVENLEEKLQYIKEAYDLGIRINAMLLYWNLPSTPELFTTLTKDALVPNIKYFDSLEIGNEEGLYGRNSLSHYEKYVKNCFTPVINELRAANSTIVVLNGSLSGPDTTWMRFMKENGMWENIQGLNSHAYGFPWAPDSKDGDAFWHVENTMKITANKNKEYGEKPIYYTEVGFPAGMATKEAVCLRTQADYLLRTYVLGTLYDGERIEWYNMIDSASNDTISTTDYEYHFGLFYRMNPDGLLMPKPSASAYITMTSLLDGIKSTEEFTVEKDVRAFNIKTYDNKNVSVLWSTKEIDELDHLMNRPKTKTPKQTWENNWESVHNVSFESKTDLTVVDSMGNEKVYKTVNGSVTVPLTGSPVFVYGF